MQISFSIPGRPSGKERPRFNAETGSVYTTRETIEDERAIARAYKAATIGRRPLTGPVKLTVIAVFAIPPSWPKRLREEAATGQVWHVARGQLDLDNAIKLVSDALNKIAFVDDAQVAVITCGKRYGHPERMDITIEALPQSDVATTPGQRALEARIAQEGWDAVLAPPPRRANRPKASRGGRGRPGQARVIRGFGRGPR